MGDSRSRNGREACPVRTCRKSGPERSGLAGFLPESAASRDLDGRVRAKIGAKAAGGWRCCLHGSRMTALVLRQLAAMLRPGLKTHRGSLSGKLTDLHSTPLEGVTVIAAQPGHRRGGAHHHTQKTELTGLQDWMPGEYTLEAESPQLGRGRVDGIVVDCRPRGAGADGDGVRAAAAEPILAAVQQEPAEPEAGEPPMTIRACSQPSRCCRRAAAFADNGCSSGWSKCARSSGQDCRRLGPPESSEATCPIPIGLCHGRLKPPDSLRMSSGRESDDAAEETRSVPQHVQPQLAARGCRYRHACCSRRCACNRSGQTRFWQLHRKANRPASGDQHDQRRGVAVAARERTALAGFCAGQYAHIRDSSGRPERYLAAWRRPGTGGDRGGWSGQETGLWLDKREKRVRLLGEGRAASRREWRRVGAGDMDWP